MLKFMIYIYDFTKNYGVAIIILTIVVKLLTYPLTIKSMASMKKMQAIQPKLMELRAKFKNEPQKLNAAMMELYRKHGVNPMSGCLPMIIQIPIFFALYKALLVSVELKGSPFIFWITDLSAKDPYYITPIIMGITMFIQQKMTPSTMDPMQQKLFLFMPIIFTFLFLNFPSGLVIYWLTNNILSIAQQYYINKKIS
jgi:YidC/Oxa1 family membrane protein insertase